MRYLISLFCIIFSLQLQAISLREYAPHRYVVKQGDTLWSIANEFLRKPWEWKSLWHANPQIHNPNHLYPGDEIVLRFSHNKPYLQVMSNGTIKLSPHMRPVLKDDFIPPIPYADIKPFLNESIITEHNELLSAPYIVALDGLRLRGGQGDIVFVKDYCPPSSQGGEKLTEYAIFRDLGEYKVPGSDRVLGYKAFLVGQGTILEASNPARMQINTINALVNLGDRIMPNPKHLYDLYFEPKAPDREIKGQIIDIIGDTTRATAGLVVALDEGKDKGLEAGDVLAVYSPCRVVRDPLHHGDVVNIPPQRLGEVMIFRAFSKTSFGLIMRSSDTIKTGDSVTNP